MEGIPIADYTKCPLCGGTRLLGNTNWSNFTIEEFIIQVRTAEGGKVAGTGHGYRGSARGHGFHLIPEGSLRLRDITEGSKYFQEAKDLAAGARRVVQLLEENGF